MASLQNNNLLLLIIFLLASPALSIVGLTGVGFFPNEKLAILLVFASTYAWSNECRQLHLFGLVCASILSFLLFSQLVYLSEVSIRPSINSIFVFLTIPLYYSFLSRRPHTTCRLIFYVGVLQFCISLFQQYFSLAHYYDIANILNNYPHQETYRFPVGETGFIYRTSGLFFESSGYAVFQWLSIICALKTGTQKRPIGFFLLLLMTLEVVINGSLAGYVFILSYSCINISSSPISKSKILRYFSATLVFVIVLSLLVSFNYFNFYGFLPKLLGQFDFLYNGSVSTKPSRLKGLVESFSSMINSDFWLYGVGFSWIAPTLDFYSLYFKSFGLIGLLTISSYLLVLLRQAPLNYKIAVILVLSINGHLSTSINILLLSMPLVFFKMEKLTHRGKV
jgi:hypothetical protein